MRLDLAGLVRVKLRVPYCNWESRAWFRRQPGWREFGERIGEYLKSIAMEGEIKFLSSKDPPLDRHNLYTVEHFCFSELYSGCW
jgi:hypothetical protein